jgi:hypothetical protein
MDVGLELEKLSYGRTIPSHDRREALLAVSQKRKPRFEGR